MVEQAQTYFKAAISAAILNAMAAGAFVLFMMLSSLQGWPLHGLLGIADPVAAPSAPSATNVDRSFGGNGGFGRIRSSALRPDSAAAPRGVGTASLGAKLSGPNLASGGHGALTPNGVPSWPASGGPGPSGPGGSGGGPIGGAPNPPALPSSPSAHVPKPPPAIKNVVPKPPPAIKHVVPKPPPAIKHVVPKPPPAIKNVVPKPPPVVKNSVQSTVNTANAALGGLSK